jgi:hypothetical protein
VRKASGRVTRRFALMSAFCNEGVLTCHREFVLAIGRKQSSRCSGR